MAHALCPQCGKEVDTSEGYCIYCGYTFDDGQLKSPFASAANAQYQAGEQFEETSGGSPVIRFDGNSSDYMPLPSGKGSGDLMFGIGFSRILAIFFAGLVLLSMLIPFVTVRIIIPKSSIPKGADTTSLVRTANDKKFDYKDDGKNITISKSASLIGSANHYLFLMIGACITGIVFAVKGKPAAYLLCGIGGAILGVFNYIMNFSTIDAVTKSTTFTKLSKAMAQTGIVFNIEKGAGAFLLIIGCVGMIVAAIIFINNHEAYDD